MNGYFWAKLPKIGIINPVDKQRKFYNQWKT